MQRIDENTYIDDTLVTCAEYQLFIDEMREHGKYFQPDHWTSYRFPSGKAHEPIAGVRFEDAKAFCEWLTKREEGKSTYRLPTSIEGFIFPLKTSTAKYIMGYWSKGDKAPWFTWITDFPTDPLAINLPVSINHKTEILHERYLFSKPTIDANLYQPLDFDPMIENIKIIGSDLASINNFLNPTSISLQVKTRITNPEQYQTSVFNQKYIDEFTQTVYSVSNRNLGINRDIASALNLAENLHTKLTTHAVGNMRNFIRHTILLLNEVIVYLLALKERTNERIPAFEGIRIVKERVK